MVILKYLVILEGVGQIFRAGCEDSELLKQVFRSSENFRM